MILHVAKHITEGKSSKSKEGVWVYLKWDYNFNFMFALLHIFSCFEETFLLDECEFSENVAISTFFFLP